MVVDSDTPADVGTELDRVVWDTEGDPASVVEPATVVVPDDDCEAVVDTRVPTVEKADPNVVPTGCFVEVDPGIYTVVVLTENLNQ